MTLDDRSAPPQRRATYRVQLRPDFNFAAVAEQAGYLADLGISHVYCSPYTQAAAASTHGYDVVDPTRLSDDLGGAEGYGVMCDALRAHGLSQVLDIVPNHMSVADRRNVWWWDVLADGPASPYAAFFDIDWEADEPGQRHRILLPVLEDQVGRVLEDGLIKLVREDGTILIAFADSRYPLSVETIAALLAASHHPVAVALGTRVAALPAGTDAATRRTRATDRAALTRATAALLEGEAGPAVDPVLNGINSDVAALDRILNDQHHRLARWRTAVEQVNYRRFFDINTLVALRIEDEEVFATATALVSYLVRRGDVDGLRVDHIDGLRRPLQYAQRLRDATTPETWLLGEKILRRDEEPPPWALDGSSGYDFLADVNGLFVDPSGRTGLEALHEEVTGQTSDFALTALESKREVLRSVLVSDVERITGLLANVCEAYPAQRDHTRTEMRDAIVELVAATPVYRTYVDPRDPPPSPTDVAIVREAVAEAKGNAPEVDPRLLDFICDLFVLGEPEDVATADEDTHLAESDLVMRLQQLCATAMAKGVEDTADYRHLVLVSCNEVGDSPAHLGTDVPSFHARNARVQERRPLTLLATSTHDTKRSEDVRCRIDLLSEMPEEWASAVRRWRAMNDRHRRDGMPDASMEYLLYQTLVGAFPLSTERAVAYMDKAAHEAKRQTSWLQLDEAYDTALAAFVTGILDDPGFVADLEGFVSALEHWGRVNSLGMALLKLTCPGVPDVYQGCELWDLSLVDPDNRRPVDYALRRSMLAAGAAQTAADAWAADPAGGAAKLLLTRDALAVRRRRPEAFGEFGTYVPVRAEGAFADDVVAFTRGEPAAVIAIAQRRALSRSGQWRDTIIALPDGGWHNLCDGSRVGGGRAGLEGLLGRFPVALLERDA